MFPSLGDGLRLWVAEKDRVLAGSVWPSPSQKDNGRHRAEVQKLLVHTAFRRQGTVSKLMAEVETFAQPAAACSFWIPRRV